MRRLLLLAIFAAAASGCVSVEGLPDPKGALKPGQRLVVNVFPAPGPWIVASADTKAESAAQITPLGFLVQAAQDQRTLSASKNLQQYLPRPNLGLAVQESLLKGLRVVRSTSTVQTGLEAGIVVAQLAEWNKSKDQLDWRERYYFPDPDQPSPRDYARVLTLDDALILDVNVSFGTIASDDGRLLPTVSAASRVYRGDTSHLLWENEDVASDTASSATLTDYQMQPWTLTDDLKKLAPSLGSTIAASFLKAFTVAPSTSDVHIVHPMAPISGGGGLVPMSMLENLSTSTVSGSALPPSAPPGAALSTTSASVISAPVSASTAAVSGIIPSTTTAPAPVPSVSPAPTRPAP